MSNLYEEVQIVRHGIWQRRWVALGVAWSVCLLGWLAIALVPNVYESRLRVFTQPIHEPGLAAEQDRRDHNVIRRQYDKLHGAREDARPHNDARSDGVAAKFRVIELPTTSSIPASSNRPLLLLGVFIAGIGAGVGVAFVLSLLRTTYATTGRLERVTGMSVIGSISEVATPERALATKRQSRWFYTACGGLSGLCLLLIAVEFIQRGMSA